MDPETSLHALISTGDVKEAREILKSAGDPSSLNKLLSARDLRRLTPIHAAANAGNVNFVNLLIEFKANLNALDGSGETALHKAASRGNFTVCESLFKALITDDDEAHCVLDGNRQSAFYRAAHRGHVSIVDMFLKGKLSFFSDVLDGGFAAVRAGHPGVAQKIVDVLKVSASTPGDHSHSLDADGFERTVLQLQLAVHEWNRTARDVSRRSSDTEVMPSSANQVAQQATSSVPLDDGEQRDLATIMSFIRKRKDGAPARISNVAHIPPLNHERRPPLRNQIISIAAIKVDGVKAPSAGPEDPDSVRQLLPAAARDDPLVDGPSGSDGPAPDGRDNAPAAMRGPASPFGSGYFDQPDAGPVVFNFEIVLAPAPAAPGGAWCDDEDDSDVSSGEDSDGGEWEGGDGDGAVFEFNMGAAGGWAQDDDDDEGYADSGSGSAEEYGGEGDVSDPEL